MCLQVLFCSLTGDQRDLYRAYLSSEEVQDILNVRPSPLPCSGCGYHILLPIRQASVCSLLNRHACLEICGIALLKLSSKG